MSKCYSYKSQPKVFKLFQNFLPHGPHKNCIWDFWNFENWNFNDFFPFSLTWDPMGAKISKCYSSYKLQPNVLKLLLHFFNGPQKTTFGNFWNWNVNEFITVLDYSQAEGYSCGLMASHNFCCFFFDKIFSKNSLWQFSQNLLIWNSISKFQIYLKRKKIKI